MLAVALFLGYFVALAESSTEKKSNEESIVRILYETESRETAFPLSHPFMSCVLINIHRRIIMILI